MNGIAFIGAIFAFFIASLMNMSGDGISSFASALIAFLCIDFMLWTSVIKNNTVSFALQVVFASAASIKLFALIVCSSTVYSDYSGFPWGQQIFDAPITAALGVSFMNLTLAVVIVLWQRFDTSSTVYPPPMDLLKQVDSKFEIFLIFAGMCKLLYWLALIDFSNPIFFLIRRMDGALAIAPLFVGMTAFRFKYAFRFWILVFVLNLAISALTGTRGTSILPILYFLIGIAIALPDWKTRYWYGMIAGLPVCMSLALFGVLIGVVRDIHGRTDLATALSSGTLLERAQGIDLNKEIDKAGGIMYKVGERMTSWPPLVVPTMTPNPVPFRGFDDIEEEFRAVSSIRIGQNIDSGFFYFANFHLKPYGFAVHVGRDSIKTSSVELSAFVDGFTRGGWLVGFLYCVIGTTSIIVIEVLARKNLFHSYLSDYLIILVVISGPTRFGVIGLVSSLRLLILETILFLVIFHVFPRIFSPQSKSLGFPSVR